MASSNNKFLAILAIANMLGFIVILILFWMLWQNDITRDKNITVTYVPAPPPALPQSQTSPITQPEPSVNAEDLSIITAVAKEVKSNNFDSSERLDKQAPGAKTLKSAKTDATTAGGVFSDQEYIAAYSRIKQEKLPAQKELSKEEATSIQVTKKPAGEDSSTQNHFNKVDVSNIEPEKKQRLSLAQQVAAIAASDVDVATRNLKKDAGWKDYLNSLKEAEAERQNEMRTITVERGDSLWSISTRAYGTGFKYKKIFDANPHLTSPDSITEGETLRVPL